MSSFEKKTVPELKVLAKKKGLKGYSKLRKAELIKLLRGVKLSPKGKKFEVIKKRTGRCKKGEYLNKAPKKLSSFTLSDLKKMSRRELEKFRNEVVRLQTFAIEENVSDNEYVKLARLQSEALKVLMRP